MLDTFITTTSLLNVLASIPMLVLGEQATSLAASHASSALLELLEFYHPL